MRSRRDSAAVLQKKLMNRPKLEELAADNILPSKDPHKAAMAARAKKIEMRRKQKALTSRLLQRPERWDLHRRGVLEREGEDVEVLTVRQRMKRKEATKNDNKPDFYIKTGGTKSRSQMRREEEESALSKKREQTIKKLSTHLRTRPKKDEVAQRVNIPSFINGTTGREYYVLNSADFNSPGKPLGVKQVSSSELRATS